jgi:malate dehydrogenase (oxaloacetate-decarboxylating)(NADP+)
MEGKAVLFKKFANIDSFDIEVDETDIDKFVDTVARLEPSFGGINLEDIKAPECFEIERRLRERMKIPVFHDDQHGTAIIVSAAMLNWLELKGKKITDVKLVANGAGASALACLTLLNQIGLPKDNIIVCDRKGVVYKGRAENMDPYKEKFANATNARTLEDALEGADIFLGLSGPNVLDAAKVAKMGKAPLIMALSNPTPEIMPDEALKGKPDAIICTGRSDFPNQVNNVLCFPFLFRGALDVGATAINEEMKIACVKAIAALARREPTDEVIAAYPGEALEFGPNYMIPKPFDSRLITELSIAVAKAAMETGVATRPIKDWDAYREKLQSNNTRSTMVMRPLFSYAKADPKRIVYCEGEEDHVLRAIQMVLDEKIAKPIVIGRREVVTTRIKRLRLRMEMDKDFELVDPQDDPRYKTYWETYHRIMERRGVTQAVAKITVRTATTAIGALMVHLGDADSIVCGTVGDFQHHMKHIVDVIGLKRGVETAAALRALLVPKGVYFVCDTHVNPDPSVAQISEMTLLAVEEIRRFGIVPRVAMLSHSNFGSHTGGSAYKMRAATLDIKQRAPDLEIDGEMHADTALSETVRKAVMPNSTLRNDANLLIMPNLEAANISFNLLKVLGEGIPIGPMLLGVSKPSYILTPSVTTRGILNISAIASVAAQAQAQGKKRI